jgi:hypothetical protein
VCEDAGGDALVLDGGDRLHARRAHRAVQHPEAPGALHQHRPCEAALATGVFEGQARHGGLLQAPTGRGGVSAERGARIDFIPYDQELLYKVVDALDEVSRECGKTIAQVALNWVLQRPTVSTIVIGARNEEQLRQNLGAIGWKLSAAQIARLDGASDTRIPYPYWHQRWFPMLTPPLLPGEQQAPLR